MAQTFTTASGVGRPPESAKRWHVLHVDDDYLQTELLSRQLPRCDAALDVETVTAVEAAIDRLADDRLADEAFDCLVTDFDMGDADATDLLADPVVADSDLPVVLFTSWDPVALEQTGVLDSVDEYLRKSGDIARYEVLASLVRVAIERDAERRAVPLTISD